MMKTKASSASQARQRLAAHRERYADDPSAWVRDVLGEHLWSKQIEIIEAVRDHRHVAVHSAHDTGKSFAASRLIAHWLTTHRPGEAFVVSTAPTFTQVRSILWREIARAHAKGNLPGRVNQTEWWLGKEMVALGRKPADYDPDAFQGIHARCVLVVLDEACGIPESIWTAAETLATNEESRILAIGNPDDPTSHFANVCKPGSGWHVIHVDGLESPNFTDEEIPDNLRGLLLSPVWVEERKQRWGEDDPRYISKVGGLFPDDKARGVIPLSTVKACQTPPVPLLELTDDQIEELTDDERRRYHAARRVELGFDVGAGGDEAVVRERVGDRAGRSWHWSTSDPMELAGYVVQVINETGAAAIKVDEIGIGWGVRGRLEELKREGVHCARVVGVNVGKASSDPKRFPRLRDEVWWMGRELSEEGLWNLYGLDDETVAQLIAPEWKPDSAGRNNVEKKDDTKKRLGRSPDDADALLLAFYNPPAAGFRIRSL